MVATFRAKKKEKLRIPKTMQIYRFQHWHLAKTRLIFYSRKGMDLAVEQKDDVC